MISVKTEFPFISVVVPVFNGEKTLAGCLDSLLVQTYPADCREILVVDNGSTDSTAEVAGRYPVRLLVEKEIRGPSAARNRGIAAARGEWVAFTDADCIADRDWLSRLAKGFSDPRAGCVAGEIRSTQPKTLAQRYGEQRGLLSQQHAFSDSFRPFAQTANAAYRRNVLDHLAGFDVRLSRAGEDADLAWRMQGDLGFRVVLIPEAVVFHVHRECLSGLLSQRVRNGYGLVELYIKHRLQMGDRTFRHTWWEWKSLWRKCGRLLRALAARVSSLGRDCEAESMTMVGLEILVFLADKLGQLKGSVRYRVWYL
jgi:glycosyltransferase involved in cell wall biosynthesis